MERMVNKTAHNQIKKVSITEVKPNGTNPRIIKDAKFKQLVQSIQEFPEMLELRPIIVNSDMVILGGNMRYKACMDAGIKQIPIMIADSLDEAKQKEFIVKDNVGFGEWDWDVLANEWDVEELAHWGLDLPLDFVSADEFGEGFELPDGDKAPFQQMTFTLADEQAVQIQNAIADIKLTNEYKYAETFGNENSNGNALYLIIMQWAEQRK